MLFNEAAHCVEIHLRKVSFFQLCLFIILPRIVKSLNYQNSSKVQKLPKSPKSKFVKITLMIKIHHFMRYFEKFSNSLLRSLWWSMCLEFLKLLFASWNNTSFFWILFSLLDTKKNWNEKEREKFSKLNTIERWTTVVYHNNLINKSINFSKLEY